MALETVAMEGRKPDWFKYDASLESRQVGWCLFIRIQSNLSSNRFIKQSFFSAHALLGSFCSFFLVFLLQDVCHPKRSLAPSALQFFLILLGLFPAMSQGVSYWHHWDDVLVGYGVGIAGAAASFYNIDWIQYWVQEEVIFTFIGRNKNHFSGLYFSCFHQE
jgi:hypothetical protein